jgi:sortase A
MTPHRIEPRRAAWLRRLERGLLLIGVLLLGCFAAAQFISSWDQAAATRELEQMRTPPGMLRTIAAPSIPLRPGALLGRIEISRLDLSAIVREGDDVATLRRAVGHIPGTALPGEFGNAGLAGHRDTFFRSLKDVRVGDRIVVSTPDSVVRYTVTDARVVDPTDLSVLDPTSARTLTLVTCYPFTYIGPAPKRYVVTASEQGGF